MMTTLWNQNVVLASAHTKVYYIQIQKEVILCKKGKMMHYYFDSTLLLNVQ